ncbi:MAG: hypothetical protein AB1792_09450 [Candidatus Zixiibacteriota bacterium]
MRSHQTSLAGASAALLPVKTRRVADSVFPSRSLVGPVLWACGLVVAVLSGNANAADPLPSPLFQNSLTQSIEKFHTESGLEPGKWTRPALAQTAPNSGKTAHDIAAQPMNPAAMFVSVESKTVRRARWVSRSTSDFRTP